MAKANGHGEGHHHTPHAIIIGSISEGGSEREKGKNLPAARRLHRVAAGSRLHYKRHFTSYTDTSTHTQAEATSLIMEIH